MTSKKSDRVSVSLAGGVCLLLALLLGFFDPGGRIGAAREAVFDRLLQLVPQEPLSGDVVVVDIDRESLAEFGAWPWPRDKLAELVEAIAAAKPKALAINILLPDNDAAADTRLAEALGPAPAVLALVLDPLESGAAAPPAPLAVSGEVAVPDLMIMPGVVLPSPALARNAEGLGVISLPAPDGQPVRSVLLLAGGAKAILAGFAAETLRVAESGATFIAAAPPQVLRIGEHAVPLPANGEMRLLFAGPQSQRARTVTARDVLRNRVDTARFADKIVLLGASAPEAGGLRLTGADPFRPTVQIEADALEAMISGNIPMRTERMRWIEHVGALAMGLAGVAGITLFAAGRAAAVAGALALLWALCAGLSSVQALQLADPLAPVGIAVAGMIGAAAARFRLSSVRRAAIERRFALHLSPDLVRRITDNPEELKLGGETRIITALFADIEGFTAMTERVGAERMVALLDRYIDTVASLIIKHGGMVDKIVGDGLIGFFNAPVDQPSHTEEAVACAVEIIAATEALRREPDLAEADLGRTRVGIETGSAVLGDVGRGAKRNYTALGRAVNMAARLEAANKKLGSSIALGPGAVLALGGRLKLRSLGKVELRGFAEPIEIFEPVTDARV